MEEKKEVTTREEKLEKKLKENEPKTREEKLEEKLKEIEEEEKEEVTEEKIENQKEDTTETAIEEEKKSEATEQDSEKKKKKKTKIIIISLVVVILLLIIAIICLIFTNKNNKSKNENTTEQVSKYDENSLYPPEGAKIIDINTLNNGHGGALSLHCTFKDTLNYVEDRTTKPGDEIECSYGFEVVNGLKVDTIYFQLDYGKGLKLTSTSNIKSGVNMVDGNRTRSNFKNPGSIQEEVFTYYFEVTEEATSENLTIDVSDIVIKTTSNDYYKLNDVNKKFTRNSEKYYIYKITDEEGEKYIDVSDEKITNPNSVLYSIYECTTDECEYLNNDSGDYVLFEDGGYKAYNYDSEQVEDLSKFNKYHSLELVANEKLIGVITYEGEQDDTVGYYSLEKNKYIVRPREDNFFFVKTNYIYYFDEDEDSDVKVIDFQGNKYKPTKKDLKRFGNTDFYLFELEGIMESYIFLYDKNSNEKFNGKVFYTYSGYPFEESSNHNLLMIEDNHFVEVDINENKIYKSEEYKDIILSTGYIIVIDKNEILKVIDEREKLVTEFEKLPDNYYVHWMLSGYYEYDGKDGIYVIVEREDISDEELMEYIKKEFPKSEGYTEEDWKDYLEESRGYEYYYIPSTGEKGKEVMIIGGYAKPILYLYPEKETKVTVNFEHEDALTTTYPKFKDEWVVDAKPNGDLYDKNGKYYYGLYWEENSNHYVDFHEGFYVTKENAIEFLEEKLSIIGLNDKERNEFIMYWLPILEKNGKNLVYFELTEEREAYNKLKISPKPDSLLRVAIHVKKVNKKVNIKEQSLKSFTRKGFTAVEWGGVVYK